MDLPVDPSWATAVLLVWTRLAALLTLSPIAQAIKAPPTVWVLFTLVVAGLLCTALGMRSPMPAHVGGLGLMVVSEALLGALLGLTLHAAFATLGMAGRLLDLQMGFGMASALDPVTRANLPVMGIALTLTGLSVFFGMEGHHALLRGVAASFQSIAPGALWQLPNALSLARAVGALYAMAVVVVAPVLLMLLLVELVLDVASRLMPQMNVMFLGATIKILVGLSIAAIAAPGLAPVLRRLQFMTLNAWQGLLP